MSTYQIVIRSIGFRGISLSALYERFLNGWVTLYAKEPRKLPPMI